MVYPPYSPNLTPFHFWLFSTLKRKWREGSLLVGCGCGTRGAANLQSHSAERICQNNQGEMGPAYSGMCRHGWYFETDRWKGAASKFEDKYSFKPATHVQSLNASFT